MLYYEFSNLDMDLTDIRLTSKNYNLTIKKKTKIPTIMRLWVHLDLIHYSPCVESMRVNPLRHHWPFSIYPHFKHPFLGIQTIYRAIGVVCQGRVEPDVGPSWDPGAVTVTSLAVVQTIHVDCVAEDVSGYVAVADWWHEFVVWWEPKIYKKITI